MATKKTKAKGKARPRVVFVATVNEFADAVPAYALSSKLRARFGNHTVFFYEIAQRYELYDSLPEAAAEGELVDQLMEAIEDFAGEDIDHVLEAYLERQFDPDEARALIDSDDFANWEYGFHASEPHEKVVAAFKADRFDVCQLFRAG